MNRVYYFKDGTTVSTWWDKHSRNWITAVKDEEGNQIGDADFAGCKETALANHNARVKEKNDKNVRSIRSRS